MVLADADTFSIEGEPKIYVKTAASGNPRAQAFCPECGSPLYAADLESPTMYAIRLGAIRQRHDLGEPKWQIWCDSALPWAMDLSGVAATAREPD